jgi:hypothetical protein
LKDKAIDLSNIQNKIDELQNKMIEQKIETDKKKKKILETKIDEKKEDSDDYKNIKKRKCHKVYSVNKKLTIVATSNIILLSIYK